MKKTLSVAVCQMMVGNNKNANFDKAEEMIKKATEMGAQMVILPEMFNSPYQTNLISSYAESYPGLSTMFMSRVSRENHIILIGGSIPEKDEHKRIYNTCFTYDEKGNLINKYRKLHLFDIDIKNKITFKESDIFSPGNSLGLIKHNGITFSTIICYDCRFPELSRLLTLQGVQLLLIPAAFNTTTGPLHWELLMRSRAVDNQVFVIAASPARNPNSSYQSWGHSMIVDPWGKIIQEADENEGIIYAELDFEEIEKVREEIPVLTQRRTDLYDIKET